MAINDNIEIPVDDITNPRMPSAARPNEPSQPVQEIANIQGNVPMWATEEPVADIINSTDQTSLETAVIEKEALRAEALVLVTNIAEKQSREVLADITTKVLEGYKIDLASRQEWEELNRQVIDLVKLLVKKKTYAGEVS